MKILIILNLVIIYLGVGFLYAFVGEVLLYLAREDMKRSGKNPYSVHPIRSLKIRFKKVFLWPHYLGKYLNKGLY
jgi:hypothetical protein